MRAPGVGGGAQDRLTDMVAMPAVGFACGDRPFLLSGDDIDASPSPPLPAARWAGRRICGWKLSQVTLAKCLVGSKPELNE